MWDLSVCVSPPPISSVTLKSSVKFYYRCLQSLDTLKLARLRVDMALPRCAQGLCFCTVEAAPLFCQKCRLFLCANSTRNNGDVQYVCTGWVNVIWKDSCRS